MKRVSSFVEEGFSFLELDEAFFFTFPLLLACGGEKGITL